MKLGLDRTTVIFFIFLAILAGIFGAQRFAQNQPPIEVTVAVDPVAEEWIQQAALAYNEKKTIVSGASPAHISIIIKDDLDVWRGNPGWNSNEHPHGWIPSSSISADLTPPTLPFEEIRDSVGRSPLVWGGYADRVALITANDTRPFDWPAVQESAVAQRWENLGGTGGNINMAINWPASSMAGIGAILSATADYSASPNIVRQYFLEQDFLDWFQPIQDSVLNSQRIGGSPAEAMASRGKTIADYALLPEAQWLQSLDGLVQDGFVFSYPAYQFVLDFPVLRWDDPNMSDAQRAGLDSFADFLLSEEGQAIAMQHGFRPAIGEPAIGTEPFAGAEQYGMQLAPDYGQQISTPKRASIEGAIGLVQ